MSALAAAAMTYARSGWPVFPLVPREKSPLTPAGFKDASCDQEQVVAWWRRWPAANIGVSLEPIALFVVDIDTEDARDAWGDLCGRNGGHEPTRSCVTGGGGLHVYFRNPGYVGNSPRGLREHGLHVRGAGGYVVVPPSETKTRYQWVRPEAPATGVAAPPGWLAKLLLPPPEPVPGDERRLPPGTWATPYGAAALAGILDQLRAAEKGVRNTTLNGVAFRTGRICAAGQLDPGVARRELVDTAVAFYGCSQRYAEIVVDSGMDAGARYPVRLEDRR